MSRIWTAQLWQPPPSPWTVRASRWQPRQRSPSPNSTKASANLLLISTATRLEVSLLGHVWITLSERKTTFQAWACLSEICFYYHESLEKAVGDCQKVISDFFMSSLSHVWCNAPDCAGNKRSSPTGCHSWVVLCHSVTLLTISDLNSIRGHCVQNWTCTWCKSIEA